jgi:hypothetical protein
MYIYNGFSSMVSLMADDKFVGVLPLIYMVALAQDSANACRWMDTLGAFLEYEWRAR